MSDPVDSGDTATAPKPRRGLLFALIGSGVVILALGLVVVFLLVRGGPPSDSVAALPDTDPTPVAIDPSPSVEPIDGIDAGSNEPAPAQPAPVDPAPAKPAPAAPEPPAKQPLKEGIVSFSARPYTGNTLASECAQLQGEAASQQDFVLMTFTWVSAGMKDGGEIKVDNSYGGSSDLQNIPASGNVLFDFDCFELNGDQKTTSYQLVLSTGTTRHAAQIILSASGPVGGMTTLY